MNNEVPGRGRDAGNERIWGADKRVTAGDGANAGNAGYRGVKFETVDVDKLTELQPIGEDEIDVTFGEGDVGGVEGIGKLDIEPMIRPEIGAGQCRDYANNLQEGRAVFSGDAGAGVHGLQQLEQDSRIERGHCLCVRECD